jgi:hypothetical protein
MYPDPPEVRTKPDKAPLTTPTVPVATVPNKELVLTIVIVVPAVTLPTFAPTVVFKVVASLYVKAPLLFTEVTWAIAPVPDPLKM